MTATNNQRTVQSYEGYARQYAAAVSRDPSPPTQEGARRLVQVTGAAATILEIGSGPGWDADFVESLGASVRRTDITAAFRELQAERGKHVDALDVLEDDLSGPYHGIMAMCVLLNIDRDQVATVLGKVSRALIPAGAFLVSLREGEGELWERSEASGDYHVVLWSEPDFASSLRAAGLEVLWRTRHEDSDGTWLTFLAQRSPSTAPIR
jgi:hypothetical protein